MYHVLPRHLLLRPAHAAPTGLRCHDSDPLPESGLDKVFNWKGNKEWLTGHFANSPLRGTVPLLLPVITLVELGAGVFSAAAFIAVLWGKAHCFGTIGMALGMVALIMLFFGQRVAKDYAGAASLVPYFLLCAAGLWVFGGC